MNDPMELVDSSTTEAPSRTVRWGVIPATFCCVIGTAILIVSGAKLVLSALGIDAIDQTDRSDRSIRPIDQTLTRCVIMAGPWFRC